MTDEDDEFERVARETAMRRANCQHRWEPSELGKRYWEPGTYQYQCKRCGAMEMVTMNRGEPHAGALAKDLPGGATDATT